MIWISVDAEKISNKVKIKIESKSNEGVEKKLTEADEEMKKQANGSVADCKKKAEEAQEEELRFQEILNQTKLKYKTEFQAVKSKHP